MGRGATAMAVLAGVAVLGAGLLLRPDYARPVLVPGARITPPTPTANASPSWTDVLDRVQLVSTPQGTRVYVHPRAGVGWVTIDAEQAWAEYVRKTPAEVHGRRFHDQFVCHLRFAGNSKPTWDLESWRPDVGYQATVLALCNPS